MMSNTNQSSQSYDIAIIGLAGQFPNCASTDELWTALCQQEELIHYFSDEALLSSGVDQEVLSHSNYVKAGGILKNYEHFDPEFFSISNFESKLTDPQHRLFLQNAYHALEDAAIAVNSIDYPVGVFASCSMNTYILQPALAEQFHKSYLSTLLANDKDFLASKVSYKLNLTGPSMTVQTACSSSLTCVHLACQSLLAHECDTALAGGVSVKIPHNRGYFFQEEDPLSPDGHTRSFDASAKGTVFGSGVGIVILKRLEDAIADSDNIYAIIKSSAVNNDGSDKVAYSAPSINGQADVVSQALILANVGPSDISFIEAHGSGTSVGDPIEIKALSSVYQQYTNNCEYCAIGSIKSNLGHLDAAAGITGLIKAALALKHASLPASINYEKPNALIEFDQTPFYVNTKTSKLNCKSETVFAGITSTGMGGSNVHMILQNPPEKTSTPSKRLSQLIITSAKNSESLKDNQNNLSQHIEANGNRIADIAYSSACGRSHLNHRAYGLYDKDTAEANTVWQSNQPEPSADNKDIIFVFPGQGAQYVNMARALYDSEEYFKQTLQHCFDLSKSHIEYDLLSILYPAYATQKAVVCDIDETQVTQPLLFCIEYALAKLLMHWGIMPKHMIGHSIGEYVAACLADVFTLEDAMCLVCKRASLMQALPRGKMIAVLTDLSALDSIDPAWYDIAAVNQPKQVVLSGSHEDIDKAKTALKQQGINAIELKTSHAFHSKIIEQMQADFIQYLNTVDLNSPRIKFVSNVTGELITDEQATSPQYWYQHSRSTVQFFKGITLLDSITDPHYIEVGPGDNMTKLIKKINAERCLQTLSKGTKQTEEHHNLMQCLGDLWLSGVDIQWHKMYESESRIKTPLPKYAFNTAPFLFPGMEQTYAVNNNTQTENPVQVFAKTWIPFELSDDPCEISGETWVIFHDKLGLSDKLMHHLISKQCTVINVYASDEYKKIDNKNHTIALDSRDDYQQLFSDFHDAGILVDNIIYACPFSNEETDMKAHVDSNFYAACYITQGIAKYYKERQINIGFLTNHLYKIDDQEIIEPIKSLIIGPASVIPKEHKNISSCLLDIDSSTLSTNKSLSDNIIKAISSTETYNSLAVRGNKHLKYKFDLLNNTPQADHSLFRKSGTYLIFGGLGHLGLELSEYLATTYQAQLILVSRDISKLDAKNKHYKADLAKRINNIKKSSTAITVKSVDINNKASVAELFSFIREEYGALNGIIHSAAILDERPVELIDAISANIITDPKLSGTQNILELSQNYKVDFVLLISSITAHLAPILWAQYVSVNNFINHSVDKQPSAFDVYSLELCGLYGRGLAEKSATGDLVFDQDAESKDIIEIIDNIKLYQSKDIVIYPGDFNQLYQSSNHPSMTAKFTVETNVSSNCQEDLPTQINSEIEAGLDEILTHTIGIDSLDKNHQLSQLDCDSLVALKIISQIKDKYNIDIRLKELFNARNIYEIYTSVEEKVNHLRNQGE